jgi:hypothetical protein
MIGVNLYHLAVVKPPMGPLIESYLKSCIYSKTNPFYDFICIVEPFFIELLANDVGKSILGVFGTCNMVRCPGTCFVESFWNEIRRFCPRISISKAVTEAGLHFSRP